MKCVRCERPLRGHRDKAADHPGTVLVRGDGRCKACLRVHSADPARPVFNLVQARSALDGYIAARRRRLSA